MRLALLTYDAPHRKTEDVIWRLLAAGYDESSLVIVATPWEDRPQRRYIYAHRPGEQPWPCVPIMYTKPLAATLGLAYRGCTKHELPACLRSIKPDVVLIGGAGILHKDIVDEFTVLNVHPGFLPMARGLDILKWCVMEMIPVGVTAHICDDRPDLGHRVLDTRVPVYSQDSFQSFALRQYELELGMIVPALIHVRGKKRAEFDEIDGTGTESRRRMPRKLEAGLPEAFERYKRAFEE